jgi:hypothetical protein
MSGTNSIAVKPAENKLYFLRVEQVPAEFALKQNYPNPFNPVTVIRYQLSADSRVTLKVYNILGQEITTLLDHQDVEAGNQEVSFNANELASGVYFYRLNVESSDNSGSQKVVFTDAKKMMLIR